MSQLKPLEDSILERHQFLLAEFDASNDVSELVLGFVEYCDGCISMFKRLNPGVPFQELRPFFAAQPDSDPRPLASTNEAAFWVRTLAGRLERMLLALQQQELNRGA